MEPVVTSFSSVISHAKASGIKFKCVLLYKVDKWRDTIAIYHEANILIRFMPNIQMTGRILISQSSVELY
uniref:AlNc14C60G4445 protein n=1 Tax=Albugo laibachii Nc14 TaxID=890382 RepID=F0WCR6_9STRA|nr:AlNc14C60G4445 [Albugo laibachii Nc14]|eukprot:CCA18987.1 AlNc14C60G4445 [Albugo laibachii Nc14]